MKLELKVNLAMVTGRDSPMKLRFILISCIMRAAFDGELFSVTVAGQCVCYTCSNRGGLLLHEVNRGGVTACELSVKTESLS